MVGGVYWLLLAISHAKNDEDLRDSEEREAFLKKELGIFRGQSTSIERLYRATYRHPVLTRLPGVILIAASLVILLVEKLR